MEGKREEFSIKTVSYMLSETCKEQELNVYSSVRQNSDTFCPSILGTNPGHDGGVAFLRNHSLVFSLEAEKDSNPRHMHTTGMLLLSALQKIDHLPDAVASSGWTRDDFLGGDIGAGYFGFGDHVTVNRPLSMFGNETLLFETTHERSHIFCSYGMSAFLQGEPCYMLLYEGEIGAFYEIDERVHINRIASVMEAPGYKYSFLFDLADPQCSFGATHNLDSAGKLMAIAGYSTNATPTADESRIIQAILTDVTPPRTDKNSFKWSPYLNCGVTSPMFLELAGKFSNALFSVFHDYARKHLVKGYPLLIGGGCGLNCDWNTRWRNTRLFRDVFVPPVTNDSGSAIGAAVEAQYRLDGCAKISWDVYSGENFVEDGEPAGLTRYSLNYDELVRLLAQDKVLAWVQGRYEIGPRALGNRSLLAAPFRKQMKDRLNRIKQREFYRPIAPVCLEEDAKTLFGLDGASPYMLHFQRVRDPNLEAITHVDGSARVQTVSSSGNLELYTLLKAFKKLTGYGVLCNTSLNHRGKGFINSMSELAKFVHQRGVDAIVVGSNLYVPSGRGRSTK